MNRMATVAQLAPAAVPPTVLVVDDTPQNVALLGGLLQAHYHVRVASSGPRALRAAGKAPRPDLILLDVMMPGMDGYEVLHRLQADPATREIPVIFITALDGADQERRGLELGAVDYVAKPFNPAVVLARVGTQLELKRARDQLRDQNGWLEAEVARRMRENQLIQDLSILAMTSLAETRDSETGHHILRTQAYVETLAHRLVRQPAFAAALGGSQFARVVKAAPLHDLGKIGIPDAILLKPGRLTAAEFAVMQRHPVIGAQAIDRAMRQARSGAAGGIPEGGDGAFDFLRLARDIALTHHERWDGGGYPDGLAGAAIPPAGRLMALADVFDALISPRVYKGPMPVAQAVAIILEERGNHFDPEVVDAFQACREEFQAIAERYRDGEPPVSPGAG